MAEEERNINPIPIHEPTGLGGTSDLLTITRSEILSFRNWVAEYKKRLLAAQDETGTPHYKTVNGVECYNPIYDMDGNAEDIDSACGKFLELLGFTEENFSELGDVWDEPSVEHIHYIWKPQYSFTEEDFNFFMSIITGEMNDVDKVVVTHTLTAYNTNQYPNEADRIPLSMTALGYDILKEDNFNISPPPDWEDTTDVGRYRVIEENIYPNNISLKFYDSLGNELTKPSWLVSAITSIVTVSMNEAITTVSLDKVSEQSIGSTPGPWNPGDTVYSITVDETITINYNACTYDRYFICEEEDCYKAEDTSYIRNYRPYYVNLFWGPREEVVDAINPVNDVVNMFEYDGDYYLRVDFENQASPDEIAYLISNFSYVQIEEDDDYGDLLRGIIRLILFAAGAWLFFIGAIGTGAFLWKMASLVVGIVVEQLILDKANALSEQLLEEKLEQQEVAMEEAKLEAMRENKIELDFNLSFWDKVEPVNPYSSGFYNPLLGTCVKANPFTVGGEYWEPHTQLINKKEIL